MSRREPATRALLLVITVVVLLAACSGGSSASKPPPHLPAGPSHPNIVFILTDDLSWNLITPQIAPHIVALETAGRDVRPLLRRRLAVLPVAGDDLHRAVPARHEGHDERPAERWLPEVPVRGSRPARRTPSRCTTPATRPRCSASTSTATAIPHEPRDRAGPAGLVGLAREQQHRLRRVQLLAQRQRHVPQVHGPGQLRRRRAQHAMPSRSSRAHAGKPFAVEVATFAPAPAVHPCPAQRARLPGPAPSRATRRSTPTTSTRRRGSAAHSRSAPQAGRQSSTRSTASARRRWSRSTSSSPTPRRRSPPST